MLRRNARQIPMVMFGILASTSSAQEWSSFAPQPFNEGAAFSDYSMDATGASKGGLTLQSDAMRPAYGLLVIDLWTTPAPTNTRHPSLVPLYDRNTPPDLDLLDPFDPADPPTWPWLEPPRPVFDPNADPVNAAYCSGRFGTMGPNRAIC